MRRLTLGEWAAVGELIATVAVVVSLLFVAYSIDQNTEAIHGSMDNLLFEQHAELANLILADPELAAIVIKKRNGDADLTDIETVRWEKYQLNLLDIWAMAFARHAADLLGDDQWKAWDDYFAELFRTGGERLSRDQWDSLRFGFDQAFWAHVDAAVFGP